MAERSNYAWRAQSLKWGYTIKDNLHCAFDNCEEYNPLLKFAAEIQNVKEPEIQNLKEPKPWTVYRCRRCEFLCYAENTQNTQNNFSVYKEKQNCCY